MGLRIAITAEAYSLNQAPPLIQSHLYPLATNTELAVAPKLMAVDPAPSSRLNNNDALISDIEVRELKNVEFVIGI